VGAYFVGPGMVSGLFSMRFIPEAYDVQAIHLTCEGVFTNTPQAGPYRGAGRPEAAYFTERMIEHAAKQIGMDVAESRRVNLISPDKFPYNTPTWYCYDSGEFVRLLDKCIDMADWKGYAKRKAASEKAGNRRHRNAILFFPRRSSRRIVRGDHRVAWQCRRASSTTTGVLGKTRSMSIEGAVASTHFSERLLKRTNRTMIQNGCGENFAMCHAKERLFFQPLNLWMASAPRISAARGQPENSSWALPKTSIPVFGRDWVACPEETRPNHGVSLPIRR
jgi:hypothetical protein